MTATHPATAWTGDGRLERPAGRIVSLLPSATEIVCALGLESRLVAVTHECDFPADAVAGLPRVTANRLSPEVSRSAEIDAAVRTAMTDGHGIYALDDALLTDLEPDLILTQELCRVCAVAYPTVLEAARSAGGDGGPMVVSLEPHSIADVLATIGHVARLAGVSRRWRTPGRRSASAAWPPSSELTTHAAWRWSSGWIRSSRPATGFPSRSRWQAARPSSVRRASARAKRRGRRLPRARPDVVVLGLCGFDLSRTLAEWAAFQVPDALAQTPAWRDGELWAIDGSAYVSRPGPRLVDGVEILAAILAGRADDRAVRLLATTVP